VHLFARHGVRQILFVGQHQDGRLNSRAALTGKLGGFYGIFMYFYGFASGTTRKIQTDSL
jgi:hypothetical protein